MEYFLNVVGMPCSMLTMLLNNVEYHDTNDVGAILSKYLPLRMNSLPTSLSTSCAKEQFLKTFSKNLIHVTQYVLIHSQMNVYLGVFSIHIVHKS